MKTKEKKHRSFEENLSDLLNYCKKYDKLPSYKHKDYEGAARLESFYKRYRDNEKVAELIEKYGKRTKKKDKTSVIKVIKNDIVSKGSAIKKAALIGLGAAAIVKPKDSTIKKESKVIKMTKYISIDMYEVNVLIVIGDREDIPKEFKADKCVSLQDRPKEPSKLTGARYKSIGITRNQPVIYNGDMCRLVFVDGAIPADRIYTTLMHELDHVRYRICEGVGLDCPESSAYLAGYLAKMTIEIARELLTNKRG